MNLIVDHGNTALKLALFDKKTLVQKAVFLNDEYDFARQWLASQLSEPVHVLRCSVVDHVFELGPVLVEDYLELTSEVPIPINNEYKSPQTLGKDRLANAVAMSYLAPGKNALCIDLGTCVKYDLVKGGKSYLGGAISPGFEMRYKALHEFTDKLPLLPVNLDESIIGTDTATSMTLGVKGGLTHEINGFIQRYEHELKGLTIFMTGGDMRYFEKAFKNRIFANPDLTLIGLNEILDYNLQQK